jgi:hypothetical protein
VKIKAIVFGASGMVGEGVLLEALKHQDVESVLVVGRRHCNVTHPRLKEILHHDFLSYSAIEKSLLGFDACFFCLGVSSVGMNEAEYTRITYDLTMETARTLSRLNPGMTFCYVSGTGTDSTEQGRLMWARVKGRTENHLAQLPFVKTIFKVLGFPYPVWKFLSPKNVCTVEEVGLAMIQAARLGYSKRVLENLDIAKLACAVN